MVGNTGIDCGNASFELYLCNSLYATFANFDISKILGVANYLFAMVIPFNLLEGVVFLAIAFWVINLLLKPILIKYEKINKLFLTKGSFFALLLFE